MTMTEVIAESIEPKIYLIPDSDQSLTLIRLILWEINTKFLYSYAERGIISG